MIRFTDTAFVHGVHYTAGMLGEFDMATEGQLIQVGDAVMAPYPKMIAQSYAGWSRSSANAAGDATYQVLTSVVIPGGTMGLNSILRVVPEWDYPNSASTKTMSVLFGGTLLSAVGLSTGSVSGKIMIEIQNLNSLLAQKTYANNTYGVVNVARVSSAVDTSQDTAIDFEVKWSASVSSETLTLLGYSIWHYPGS